MRNLTRTSNTTSGRFQSKERNIMTIPRDADMIAKELDAEPFQMVVIQDGVVTDHIPL